MADSASGECGALQRDDAAAGWVAGHLPAETARAFEEHLLLCRRCQDEVQLALAARVALGPALEQLGATATRRWWHRGRRRGILFGTAAAAGIVAAAVTLAPRGGDELRALGVPARLPRYAGVEVRAAPVPAAADAAADFDAGLRAYRAHRFSEAVEHLARAEGRGIDPEPPAFFRGVSLLVLHRPVEARAAFDRVIAGGDSPYRQEARYYRALALLQSGSVDDALRVLAELAGEEPPVGEEARALRARVEVLRRR